jgi:hypothetical protein
VDPGRARRGHGGAPRHEGTRSRPGRVVLDYELTRGELSSPGGGNDACERWGTDLLVDARSELFELAVRSGLKVLETMLEEDRIAICAPRYAHVAERRASRAGTVSSEVVLGGRKVAVRRPRVRADGQEVGLPTFRAMADVDPLNRRVVEQTLVGVATRRYARSLEPVPATTRSRGTSKSAVSRRFVAKTTAQLAAWRHARDARPCRTPDRRRPYR